MHSLVKHPVTEAGAGGIWCLTYGGCYLDIDSNLITQLLILLIMMKAVISAEKIQIIMFNEPLFIKKSIRF